MSKITKRQVSETSSEVCGISSNASVQTLTTAQNLLSVTITNALPGTYLIASKLTVKPSGGSSAVFYHTISGSSGSLNDIRVGIHASADADYSITKHSYRYMESLLTSHTGGTFTVSLYFSPEAAVNFIFGESGDARWSRSLIVTKIG
jgi:hypothetical protein